MLQITPLIMELEAEAAVGLSTIHIDTLIPIAEQNL